MRLQSKTRYYNGISLCGFDVSLWYHSWQVCTYFCVCQCLLFQFFCLKGCLLCMLRFRIFHLNIKGLLFGFNPPFNLKTKRKIGELFLNLLDKKQHLKIVSKIIKSRSIKLIIEMIWNYQKNFGQTKSAMEHQKLHGKLS